jgi:NADH:ubiquinone oxidoreductase subunit F (NADH-binding)
MSLIQETRRVLLLDDPPPTYEAWELAKELDPEEIINTIEFSGLRGRGGAGFPTGRKLRLTREVQNGPKCVVVNGAEDEPGSGKDQLLLESSPELVVEGALIAAHAVGATRLFFYLSEQHPASSTAIRSALASFDQIRTVEPGDDPQDESDSLCATIVLSSPAYVAGEDTAALECIEGSEALPREKPPYPVESGVFGRPTLALNAETVATLSRIVLYGGAAYRSLGTAESTGTMLFTLGPEMKSSGVYELELGTPLRHLIEVCGGGLRAGEPVRFVLPGGPSSAFLPEDRLDVPLSYEGLREAGSAIGCGVVRVFGASACIVETLVDLMGFFQRECCGQCPPCRMETGLLARIIGQVAAGKGNPELLGKLTEVLDFAQEKGGLCSFIGMPGPPVRSALALFADDFDSHLRDGTCSHGPKRNLRSIRCRAPHGN